MDLRFSDNKIKLPHKRPIITNLACSQHECNAYLQTVGELQDFVVMVEGALFQCHRSILIANSGYFQGLFRSEMQECTNNRVELNGIPSSTFETILIFLYNGVIGLTNDNVLDVWSAADRLEMECLMDKCTNFLTENISTDNCLTILTCADLFSSQKLVDLSIDFIIKHFEHVRHMEHFLKLSFDHFYKVIESDYLAASSEDKIVETIMKWLEYKQNLTVTHNSEDNIASDNENSVVGDDDNCIFEKICCKITDCGGICDVQMYDIVTEQVKDCRGEGILTVSQRENTGETVLHGDSLKIRRKVNNRKQHLFKLISACSLFVLNTTYLENLLTNKLVLSCKITHNLILEALMYNQNVALRHDAWPESAVHRVSSDMKHVMIFFSNSKIMAYNLYTGSFHQFVDPPDDFSLYSNMIVFDNVLCLMYISRNDSTVLAMYTREKIWTIVNETSDDPIFVNIPLLAHGPHIYSLRGEGLPKTADRTTYDYHILRMHCDPVQGNSSEWSTICRIRGFGRAFVRFQQYILVFRTLMDPLTIRNFVSALCFNTETKETYIIPTSMEGKVLNMVSFNHRGELFLLHENGCLWKIVSKPRLPVDFELESKLWDLNYCLRGCVVYRKNLFVFHEEKQNSLTHTFQASLPGVFTSVILVGVNVIIGCPCIPMVVPDALLSAHLQ